MLPKLKLERRRDGWWIVGLPNRDAPECGPYADRGEAVEDRDGLLRTYRFGRTCEGSSRRA